MVTAHDGQASRDRGGNGTASEPDRVSIARSGGFAVDARFRAPRITLGLKGEFDLAGAPSLKREIEMVPSPELAELVFDLAEATFIDSTGEMGPAITAAEELLDRCVFTHHSQIVFGPMCRFEIFLLEPRSEWPPSPRGSRPSALSCSGSAARLVSVVAAVTSSSIGLGPGDGDACADRSAR